MIILVLETRIGKNIDRVRVGAIPQKRAVDRARGFDGVQQEQTIPVLGRVQTAAFSCSRPGLRQSANGCFLLESFDRYVGTMPEKENSCIRYVQHI